MDGPLVSVVMAAYNAEAFVSDAIYSVLNQSFVDYEFIIIDDGSTDGTVEIIEKIIDPRIIFLRNQDNVGLTKCLNQALSESVGTLVARQDADDVSLPDRLQKQVSWFETNCDLAVIGTWAKYLDAEGKIVGNVAPVKDPSSALLEENPFIHGSIMFKKEVVVNVGGYDNFFQLGQDYDLWRRVARVADVSIIPEYLYLFRQHLSNTRFSNGAKSSLYKLLTRKIIRGTISDKDIAAVKSLGIDYLLTYLNQFEHASHHKALAHMLMQTGRKKEAITEYKLAFRNAPLDSKIILNIMLAYLGSRFWSLLHRW